MSSLLNGAGELDLIQDMAMAEVFNAFFILLFTVKRSPRTTGKSRAPSVEKKPESARLHLTDRTRNNGNKVKYRKFPLNIGKVSFYCDGY